MLPDPAQGRSFPPRRPLDGMNRLTRFDGWHSVPTRTSPSPRVDAAAGRGISPRGSAACYVGTVPTSTRTETEINQPDQRRERSEVLARRLPLARVHELVDLVGG